MQSGSRDSSYSSEGITREVKGSEGTKGFMVDMEIERPSGAQKLYVVCKESSFHQ